MDIEVVIAEPNRPERKSIHPESALKEFQRVYGKFLIDYYTVDAKGNRIAYDITPKETTKEKAFRMMKEEAKRLKINGFETMNESELLKAIQTINNSSNQIEPQKVTKTGKIKTRKQNA